jgi:hypothetical protein
MPQIPEIRYLYLMSMSKRAYRAGFRVLEDVSHPKAVYSMKGLYFRKLADVILQR